ncbi:MULTISPECIES: hypothetical protein [Bacillaceae]|nr:MULTISPECIES: hypothetical protein [Bacillaceae]
MNKKFLLTIASSLLAISMLAACGGEGTDEPIDSEPIEDVETGE